VRVENLTVSYGAERALDCVSFSIKKGEFTAVMGPNGSGKTTLVKTLLGLETPASGGAWLFEEPAAGFSDWARVGYLPQGKGAVYGNFPLTVREVVAMGRLPVRKFPRFASAADGKAVSGALEAAGITDIADRLVGDISGGQQQRAFLARALVNNPDLLLLDEPGAALDPRTRDGFYETVSRLPEAAGTTVILVTHDTAEAGKYASHMLFLDSKVVFHGTREDFCASKEVEGYFGPFAQHVMCHRHDGPGGKPCPLANC
jgi:zinc transport system ATP-binding protein